VQIPVPLSPFLFSFPSHIIRIHLVDFFIKAETYLLMQALFKHLNPRAKAIHLLKNQAYITEPNGNFRTQKYNI
jgi:hypothetical protein